MGRTTTVISGVAWTIIQNIISILYGIVSVPFLINYFGKEEYGLIGLAISINVYVQLLDMGMTNSNIKFFSEFMAKGDEDKVQRLFSLTSLFYIVIGVINTIVLFGFSFFVDACFRVTPDQALILRNLLWILALNATLSWLSICYDEFLRACELVSWIKKRVTVIKLLQFAILLATILFSLSIEWYFFLYTFSATIILPLTLVKVKHVMPSLSIRCGFDKKMAQQVLPYALSVFSFGIFQFLAFNFRPLFLGNMSGPSAVADYNVMVTIASVVTLISSSVMQVLLPTVTRMVVNDDTEAINKVAFTGTKYIAIIISALVFYLVINISDIIQLYVGDQFAHISTWMAIWLLTLLLSHRNVMSAFVFTQKKLTSVSLMGAIAMVLAISSYFVFIPKYGVGGVVIGFLLHELTHTVFYYVYFMPKKVKLNTFKIFTQGVLPTWVLLAITSICVCYASHLMNLGFWPNLIVKSLLYGTLSLIVLWFIVLNTEDKRYIVSLVKRSK